MEEERDIVVFTDEEGNDLELEVLDYFFYNGEEFAVLTDVEDEDGAEAQHACAHEGCEGCDECGADQDVYIMKVVQMDDDMEEFVPVEEALMDKLVDIVQRRFEGEDVGEGDETED